MDVKIYPCKLDGTIKAVASKSMAHRILISSFLADKPTKILIGETSKDIEATIFCLEQLGGKAEKIDGGILVSPIGTATKKSRIFNCVESGSTLRFLIPVIGALGVGGTFIGEGNLPKRPIKELIDVLSGLTVSGDSLPLTISGKLNAGEYKIRGDISSQYITGLLFALPLINEDSKIILTSELESKSYVDMTIDVLNRFHIDVEETEYGYFIRGGQKYISPSEIEVEGDWSNGAFWIVASAIGNLVRVTGLKDWSKQGDKVIKKLLIEFRSSGTNLDCKDIPDLVPILAVAACYATCKTTIFNAGRLRIKESNRLNATCVNLQKLGVEIFETEDGLVIEGKGKLLGGEVDGFNDHRIVMSMAIAGTMCESPIIIHGAEAVAKSYPNFFNDFEKLGGKIDVL